MLVTRPGKKQSSSTEVLDGHPFVIGVACLLHQYPDSVSNQVIRYLAQYVRSFYVEQTAQIQAFRSSAKVAPLGHEITNGTVFLDRLFAARQTPRSHLEELLPKPLIDLQ